MAKPLNDILKGVKKSTVSKLTTGKDPGVDYADKMPDTRDYVAKHSIEKHDDRVGNEPDVYSGAKQTPVSKKQKNHGYDSDSDQKVYEAAMCEACMSENCSCDDKDDRPKGKGKKGKELLLDLAKKSLKERKMTADDKSDEAALKKKYDDSEMKQSMIKQYGPERGEQIYFATIRKKAMKSEQAPADTAIQTPSTMVGDTGRV